MLRASQAGTCASNSASAGGRSASGGGDNRAIKRASLQSQRMRRPQDNECAPQAERQRRRQHEQWRACLQQVKRDNRELYSLRGLLQYGLRGVQVVACRHHREKQYYPASERQQ